VLCWHSRGAQEEENTEPQHHLLTWSIFNTGTSPSVVPRPGVTEVQDWWKLGQQAWRGHEGEGIVQSGQRSAEVSKAPDTQEDRTAVRGSQALGLRGEVSDHSTTDALPATCPFITSDSDSEVTQDSRE
jgi:hypothetical protein